MAKHKDYYKVNGKSLLDTFIIMDYLRETFKGRNDIMILDAPGDADQLYDLFMHEYILNNDHKDEIRHVFVPYNVNRSHFVLIDFHFTDPNQPPKVTWYDSLGSSMRQDVKHIIQGLFPHNDDNINERGIKHKQQKDGYNCGVYTANNAETIAKGEYNFATMRSNDSLYRRSQIRKGASKWYNDHHQNGSKPRNNGHKNPERNNHKKTTPASQRKTQNAIKENLEQQLCQYHHKLEAYNLPVDEQNHLLSEASNHVNLALKSLTSRNSNAFFTEVTAFTTQVSELDNALQLMV